MRDDDYYRSRANERRERRERSKRKSLIATLVVVLIALAVVVGVVIVVVSLSSKNKPAEEPTLAAVAATEQAQNNAETPATAAPIPTKAPAAQPNQNSDDQENQNSDDQQNQDSGSSTASGSASADASNGSVLHYYANGKTSGGYNWDYSGGGGGIVSIDCKYDFSTQQYDFIIQAVSPGTTSFTLKYWVGDDQTVEVPMTVTVSADLSITQTG